MQGPSSTVSRKICSALLEIGAVSLAPKEPYRWASGRLSPIYCDNRKIIGYPAHRDLIAEALAEEIHVGFPEVAVVSGTATAGIPHAAFVADRLRLPMNYVRSRAKGHGKSRQVEGRAEKGDVVVLIEDLISTGGSSMAAVDALREAGMEVAAVLAIFTYQLPAAEAAFKASGLPLVTLSNYTSMIDVALESGRISSESAKMLGDWRLDPVAWSDRMDKK